VFGALPSMHCAYPVLGLLSARRAATWRTWPLHVGYTLLMFGASLYLDHHWIVDGLAGWLLAAVSVWVAELAVRRLTSVVPQSTSERPATPEVEPASGLV
jgi:membrane-associated phospholipid phosphatase